MSVPLLEVGAGMTMPAQFVGMSACVACQCHGKSTAVSLRSASLQRDFVLLGCLSLASCFGHLEQSKHRRALGSSLAVAVMMLPSGTARAATKSCCTCHRQQSSVATCTPWRDSCVHTGAMVAVVVISQWTDLIFNDYTAERLPCSFNYLTCARGPTIVHRLSPSRLAIERQSCLSQCLT
jgi:hypothetical protein